MEDNVENVVDKNIEKDCIRFFWPLFSWSEKIFITKDWVDMDIYDVPTQIFIFWENLSSIYSHISEDTQQVINKIIKDNNFWSLTLDKITAEHITDFRRLFWKHPEIESKISEISKKYSDTSWIELLNTFFKEMVRMWVYNDEKLVSLREFRVFIAKKSIWFEWDISSDIKTDLFNYLDFGRFNTDNYVKQRANETLDVIVDMIKKWECPDLRFFKNYNDWDSVPMKVVSMIEKLVLINYCDKPDKSVVEEIRIAAEKMDLDLLKEYMNFVPKWWQKYALMFESRENLAANSRRCVASHSKIRLDNWSFTSAWELYLWQRLLSSNKKDYVTITRLDKRKDITYKIKLNTWEELELTWNHRLPTDKNFHNWIFDTKEDNYKFVSELKKWDIVPTILWYKSFWNYFTYDESKLLWYLIWDWSLSTANITITKYDKKYVDIIQKLIKNCWLSSWYWEDKKIIHIQNSMELLKRAWLNKLKSSNKKIPDHMFWECENNKLAIIEWLLNTDWYIQIKWWKKWKDWYNRKKSVCIEYSSISEDLIKWIHILLNDLWIINYYNKKIKKINISTLKTDNYQAYYLYISDVDWLRKLFNNIDLKNKLNYNEANNIIFSEKEYINSNIWILPLCSIKEKKYIWYINKKDKQYYINGVRAPRYNYQKRKAKYYWTENRLEYQWSQISSIEIINEQEVIDIETDWDSLYWIWTVLSHNSWKSFLLTYINIRQIFLPWQMCLYILPIKEDYSEQPFFYIEQMLENIKKKWAELTGFQFNAKQFRVVNKNMKSKIIFLSAQWSSKGKSFSANLVSEDEAWYIDDGNVYEQAYNSTADTKGRMRSASTINVKTPTNWFFYKKVSLDGMEDARVMSVDIYNNPFIPEEEKKRKEMQYKDKQQDVWLADWMAIFVWWQEWFDISNFFQIDFVYDVVTFKWEKFNMARNLEKYERLLLFYDPAKNKDKAGLSLIWKIGKNCHVLMTGYINIKNYYLQWEVILDMLAYLNKIKQCEFGIDLGKAWEAAFDWFESKKVSPYWILSTGWSTVTKVTYRRWNVPAVVMETNLHTLMSAWIIRWFSWLEKIRNEFDTYNLSKERKWWVEHHHDVLSALMNAAFIRYERWLIWFDIKKEVIPVNEQKVDAYWRPIAENKTWSFNGSFMGKFLH